MASASFDPVSITFTDGAKRLLRNGDYVSFGGTADRPDGGLFRVEKRRGQIWLVDGAKAIPVK